MDNLSGNENSDLEKWKKTFNDFEKIYKKAYYSIDNAIKLDEENKVKEAFPLYELSLSLIDEALSQTLNEPSHPDFLWEKAVVMMQKLKKTRKEIIIRIENINSKPEVPPDELPPSYEEVTARSKTGTAPTSNDIGNTSQLPGSSKEDAPYIPPSALPDEELLANLHSNGDGASVAPITYSDLSLQLKEMKLAKNKEILFHCDNVQLYFISPDGRVSSANESNTLIIARVHDESLDEAKRTFLQVGSLIYPLIPEVLPCIRSEFGAFIFPDINANIDGAAVGLILPEEKREEFHELLTHLLNETPETGRTRRSVVADHPSERTAFRIARRAAYLAHNLVRGAESTARFLDSSTPKIIDKITPSYEPQPINPTLQKTVQVTKTVSGKAVDVTDYLATKICLATSALGRYLSPYIQRQGTRLVASTTSLSEEEADKKIKSILGIASDAVEGVSTIYSGLNAAASILGRSLANNTVQIIEYKYGQPAGALTNDAITTFGNVYYTHHNFRVLKPRGIAKAAVRGAGQAVLEDYRNSIKNQNPEPQNNVKFQGSDSKLFSTS